MKRTYTYLIPLVFTGLSMSFSSCEKERNCIVENNCYNNHITHFSVPEDTTRDWIPYKMIDSLVTFTNSKGQKIIFKPQNFSGKTDTFIVNERVSRRCSDGSVLTCKDYYTSESEGLSYIPQNISGIKIDYFITKVVLEKDIKGSEGLVDMGVKCLKFKIQGKTFYLQNKIDPVNPLEYKYYNDYSINNRKMNNVFVVSTQDQVNKGSQDPITVYYSFGLGLMGFSTANGEDWIREIL